MIPQEQWKWCGFSGHHIIGLRCRFHLTTRIGKYVVSTIGALPKKDWDGVELDTVGSGRLFETMVFLAQDSEKDCEVCGGITGESVDFLAYNEQLDAQKGHMELCRKWAEAQ